MSCQLHAGKSPVRWIGRQDNDGFRTYSCVWDVVCTDRRDGPLMAMSATGLPSPGDVYLVGNDSDVYAYCTPEMDAESRAGEREATFHWAVKQNFTTKPIDRSGSSHFGDPLLEMPRVSGTFRKDKVEGVVDRFGAPIVNSAWEQIRGPVNEWDDSIDVIKITFNVAVLQYALMSRMKDTTNDAPLWGLPPGAIKFSNMDWEIKWIANWSYYYQLTLEFEIKDKLTQKPVPGQPGVFKEVRENWARTILDEGTKALHGHWGKNKWVLDPIDFAYDDDGVQIFDSSGKPTYVYGDPNNPADFSRYKDRKGENARVILDGHGQPYNPDAAPVGTRHWWVLAGFTALTGDLIADYFEGTFAEADGSLTADQTLYGPFDSEQDARDAVTNNQLGQRAVSDPDSSPGEIYVDKYGRSNFLLLGIPTTF